MKKLYILALAATFTTAAFAQRAVTQENFSFSLDNKTQVQNNKAGTDTLYNHMVGLTPAFYSNPPGGYLIGHDSYGDLGYYQKFDNAAGTGTGSVNNVMFYFAHVEGSANSSINAIIRDDNAGAPGNIIGQVSMPFSSLDTSAAGFMNNGIVGWNSVGTFASPIAIPANGIFYAGFEVVYATGDTVGGVSNNASSAYTDAATHCFELQSDGTTFLDMAASWGDFTFAVYPVLDLSTSIETLNATSFNVYPNPSTGEFNINLTNEKANNVNLTVRNVVGKTILSKNVKVAGQQTETISLADYSKGIYFLTIDSKTVKLIVE